MSYVSMGAVAAADLAVSLIATKGKAAAAAESIVSNAGILDTSAARDWRDRFVSTFETKVDNCTRRDSTGKYNGERNPSLVKEIATLVRNSLSEAEQRFDTSSVAASPMRDLAAQIDRLQTEFAAVTSTAAAASPSTTKAPAPATTTRRGAGPTYTSVSVTLDQIRAGAASLRIFQRASAVGAIQTILRAKGKIGLDGKPIEIDNLFGPQTEFAVKAFQLDKGMSASGIVDKATLDALEGRSAAAPRSRSDLPVGLIAGVAGLLLVGAFVASRRGK
ncbi:MAG: peptidoglycan-binding protein [Betaproteobacteria bacterium]|nr:peptidoglycan-binding protein [Betaproteobacteria bacterium]